MARLTRRAGGTLLLLLATGALAAAGTDVPAPLPTDGDAYRVTQDPDAKRDRDTLHFLRANRDFFRARLDELRLSLRPDWNGDAEAFDPAWLAWNEMLRDVGAARDSAAVSAEWIRRQELLDSVGDLVELEREMDEMDELIAAQQARLAQLEADFAGNARTALVVLVTGVPSRGVPGTVVLWDNDGRTYRVNLPPEVRTALEYGGSAELLHCLIEPRAQHWDLAVEGEGWSGMLPLGIELDPERHRLTFLEVDLSALDNPRSAGAAADSVFHQWVR